MVARIESEIVMPRCDKHRAEMDSNCGALLSSYDRFYTLAEVDGREVIRGVFLLRPLGFGSRAQFSDFAVAGTIDVFAVPDDQSMPFILDGGCAMVVAEYDLEKGYWLSWSNPDDDPDLPPVTAACNGYA